jgi:predicted metal-dependent phosphoesterase TrpH
VHVKIALENRGPVDSWDSFNKYRDKITVPVQYKIENAIKLIKKAGGISILAHPITTFLKLKKSKYKEGEKILKYLKSKGLDGIEVNQEKLTIKDKKFLHRIAEKLDFLKSGGTDFHKDNDGHREYIGKYGVPYSYVKEMKKKLSLI